MKEKDFTYFKQVLTEERKRILHHLEDLSESNPVSEDNRFGSGDPADIAAIEIDQNNLTKVGKREAFLLKKIDLALHKIEEGTFGECEGCGEEIGVARLKARPVAQLCIDCKTEQENLERKFRSDGDDGSDDSSDSEGFEEE